MCNDDIAMPNIGESSAGSRSSSMRSNRPWAISTIRLLHPVATLRHGQVPAARHGHQTRAGRVGLTKQLGFDSVRRIAGAVHFDQRPLAALTADMNYSTERLLPTPASPYNKTFASVEATAWSCSIVRLNHDFGNHLIRPRAAPCCCARRNSLSTSSCSFS